jgi:group I intron endonuclease
MYYYLYKITNIKNNHCYFGSHKTINLDDGYMGSGTVLKWAIKKHGLKNFRKDIISFHSTENELRQAEDNFLKNITDKNGVYNMKYCSIGGNTRSEYNSKKKKQYIQKLINNPNSPIGKCGSSNIRFGKKWTEEFRKQRSNQQKIFSKDVRTIDPVKYQLMFKPKKVRVIYLDTNKIITFICMRDCAKYFKMKPQSMRSRIVNNRPINNMKFEYY